MGKKDILALLNLAYRLIIHILEKPVKWLSGYKGYETFVRQYKGLEPVSAETRRSYPSISLCINCGICIAQCSDIAGNIKHEIAPAYIYVSYSRMLPELLYSDRFVKACTECDTCLVHCPTGLRMKELVLLYKDMVR